MTTPKKGADEKYCPSCGEIIKKMAEICPECGVRQQASPIPSSEDDDLDSKLTNIENQIDSSKLWYYLQWTLGVLFLIASVGALTDPEMGILESIIAALLVAVIGLALIPPVRENVEKRYSLSTFGEIEAVHEESVTDPAALCSNCEGDIDTGVRRTYGTELVVSGIVLHKGISGENHYCRSCLQMDQRGVVSESPKSIE